MDELVGVDPSVHMLLSGHGGSARATLDGTRPTGRLIVYEARGQLRLDALSTWWRCERSPAERSATCFGEGLERREERWVDRCSA